ncbi:helix-turn-helix domain-containing protein [Gracilibacillus oryzae]|uniref:Helix-turn-helix domain-containing protein n=1 Tax=Gracilibacillus oryzae TaxID=1672701 RepID=A0A7C8GRD0_9BACI|nr:helix-turn-helix transcriptional regulator [Gracilibacillus oryzae]KAB8126358.1 helix-turn-helix domain-containing protein [Gracilibacillus oryzae]
MFHYGKLIRDYRKRKHMTQKELAIASNCSYSYISKIESGKIEPPKDLIVKISEILEIKELQDNYTTSPQLADKLIEWHHTINEHRIFNADKLFKELKPHFPLHHINLNTHYYINLFRHFLLRFDHAQAKLLLPRILDYTKTLYKQELYICYKSLGYYFLLDNDIKKALHYLQLARNTEDVSINEPEIHIYFAIIHIYLNEPAHAENELMEAKTYYETQVDPINHLLFKYLLTFPDILRHKHDKVVSSLEKILSHSVYHSFQIKYELIYFTLGYIYIEEKQFNKAISILRKAITKEKNPLFKVKYIYFLAIAYAYNGQKNESLDYIQIGIGLKSNRKYQYWLYILKKIMSNKLCTEETSLYIHKNMLPYFTNTGDQPQINECHLLLSIIYHKMNHYKRANSHLFNVVNGFQLAELTEKYEV